MAIQKMPSAAELGALEMLLYKTSASIANDNTAQFFGSSAAKFLMEGEFKNDKLGRWEAYDSGSGSADSLKWNGSKSIETFVTVSMAAKHNNSDGLPLYTRNLCYLSGVLQNGGHLYASAPESNSTPETSSHTFPLTFTPGDYIYYTSAYLTAGGTASTSARLEPYLYNISVRER